MHAERAPITCCTRRAGLLEADLARATDALGAEVGEGMLGEHSHAMFAQVRAHALGEKISAGIRAGCSRGR